MSDSADGYDMSGEAKSTSDPMGRPIEGAPCGASEGPDATVSEIEETIFVTPNALAAAERAAANASGHYDDIYKSFMALDGKAQGAATVAGLVLAGAYAFLKPEVATALRVKCGPLAAWLILVLPGGFALLTVVASLCAIWVRRVNQPFVAPEEIQELEDLVRLGADEQTDDRYFNLRFSRLRDWIDAIESLANATEIKARWVVLAQALLVATLILLLITLGLVSGGLSAV